jgi:predicted deacetylase
VRLLVSIHDVAPPFLAAAEELWRCCRELEIVPDLLVVPAWHGIAPLGASLGTVQWVRACVADGASALLHGFRHDEVGSPRGVGDWLRAVGRTAGEGEFLALDDVRAGRRIVSGLRVLRELGLDPIGFVPPAWLARPGLRRVVAAAGLLVTEDVGGIWLLRRRVRVASPVIRWSARTPARAVVSTLVASVRRHARRPLVRVALHPQDLHSALTRRSLHSVLAHLREHADPISYRTLAFTEDRPCAT